MTTALALHGGAGLIRRDSLSPHREASCRAALRAALDAGCAVLDRGGSAVDAVCDAVRVLEEDPVFNAGRGAVIAAHGGFELDAAVMCGQKRHAGGVTGCRTTRNPVDLARAVMDRSPHVLLAGEGSDAFARAQGLVQVAPTWFETAQRRAQFEAVAGTARFTLDHGSTNDDVYGTVGAVALDTNGHVAAATSTGGMVNKRAGRVGDTPIIRAGTFAWDRTCAVSATGHGEPCMQLGLAGRVSDLMELAGLSIAEAAHRAVHLDLPEVHGLGGVIAVDPHGNIAMPFNTGGMFRAARCANGERTVAIW